MSEAAQTSPAPAVSITTAAEAARAIGSLYEIMDLLEETMAEEGGMVRAGRIRDAARLWDTKRALALRSSREGERVKAAEGLIRKALPEALEPLRRRHEAFQAALETNMTVLATAHAVAEGVIRGVFGELARKHTPSTYGASGRPTRPGASASQPLALSRPL